MSRVVRSLRTVAALAAAMLVTACGGERAPAVGRDLLLVTLDTTRADRIGAYGHPDARTPALDRLARAGIVFENAVSPSPLTLPSHSSLLTGTDPPFHGVRYNGSYSLPAARITLAEILRDAGYETAAVVAAFVLERRFGLSQGFTRFDDDPRSMQDREGGEDPRRAAAEVTAAALEAVESLREDRPAFLWAHYFDPHIPYEPPSPNRELFPDTEEGRYQGEIASMDRAIGRLLEGLEDRRGRGGALVAVVGDHGEGFPGPHAERRHGLFLYGDTLQVPMILTGDGALPRGRVHAGLVREIDLFPTLLGLLGVSDSGESSGTNLAPRLAKGLVASDGGKGVAAYGETFVPWIRYGWSPIYRVRTEQWSFIDAPTPELYDLSNDPGERVNVAERHPEVVEELRRRVREIRETTADGAPALDPGLMASPEDVARLRALGYVESSTPLPDADALSGLEDPKDWIEIEGTIEEAWKLHLAARHADALERLETILARDPRNFEALNQKGLNLLGLGRLEAAEAAFQKLSELRPGALKTQSQLAGVKIRIATRARGRGDTAVAVSKGSEAIEILEEIARGDHLSTVAPLNLGSLYLGRNDLEGAIRSFRQVVEIDDRSFDGHLGLGIAFLRSGRFPDAGRHLARAETLTNDEAPRRKRVLHPLVDLYMRTGRPDQAAEALRALVSEFPDDPETPRLLQLLDRLERGGG